MKKTSSKTAPPPIKPLPTADALAREFSRRLRTFLTAQEMRDVLKANLVERVNGDASVCHSHDYCDANEVMDAAFLALYGRGASENELLNHADVIALWNEAWAIAKGRDFFPPTESKPLWEIEHGADFAVPPIFDALVACGVLCDTSYHNDICPSFALNDGHDGDQMQLWCDHPVAAQREMPEWPRFRVCSGPGRTTDFETYSEGDDLVAALGELFKRSEFLAPAAATAVANLYKRAYEALIERFGDLGDVNQQNEIAIHSAKQAAARAAIVEGRCEQQEPKKEKRK